MSSALSDKYFPAEQSMHVACKDSSEPGPRTYFPAAQIVQAVPALYLPTPQIMLQSDMSVDEGPELLFPYLHSSQNGDETLLWYFPTGHAMQRAEDGPLYWPAAQSEQVSEEVAETVSLYLPAAHEEQVAEAVPLYLPAAHDEQDAEAVPLYCPAAQFEQAEDSTLVAAVVKYLPEAHDEQDAEAAPLYWPVLQLVQAKDSMPVAALVKYFPAGQLKNGAKQQ